MQRPRFDDEFKDLAALAYRVAFRILGNRATAEDISQESWLAPTNVAKMIDFIGAISTIPPADLRTYQIEVTGKIISGSDVLVWHKDSPNMRTILDIFRGITDPAPPVTSSAGAAPVPNTPVSAIVPGTHLDC